MHMLGNAAVVAWWPQFRHRLAHCCVPMAIHLTTTADVAAIGVVTLELVGCHTNMSIAPVLADGVTLNHRLDAVAPLSTTPRQLDTVLSPVATPFSEPVTIVAPQA